MGSYGVIWDMDGVLVDTGDLHYQTWVEVLREYGIRLDRETFVKTFGMNNTGVLTSLLGYAPTTEYVQEVGGRKEAYFRQIMRGQATLMAGVKDWLERLQTQGVRQAIASSAPPENIDALVDELHIRKYFQVILSCYDMPGKPDPAVFLKAANLIGVPPGQCVVVEDALPGVEAARRGGMRCIAVTTTNPAALLQGADVIVERLDALPLDVFERLVAGESEQDNG
jgi:beta-phosphoglucomutase family hydrolase